MSCDGTSVARNKELRLTGKNYNIRGQKRLDIPYPYELSADGKQVPFRDCEKNSWNILMRWKFMR